jgi:alanyl-tRNA synthetase
LNKWYSVPLPPISKKLKGPQREQGGFFPEIQGKIEDLREILNEEEESFARTLDRGEKLFETYVTSARTQGRTSLAGADVWRLYDTYGFPVDLTLLMAEEAGLSIDQKEFEEAMEKSKEASKGLGKKGDGQTVRLDVHDLAVLGKNEDVPKTDDSFKFGSLPLSFSVNRRGIGVDGDEVGQGREMWIQSSKRSTILPNSSHQHLKRLRTNSSGSFSIEPTFTPNREVRRTIRVGS